MRMTFLRVLTVLGAAAVVSGLYPDSGPDVVLAQSPEQVEFHRDVRPVLAQACFACHGAAEATRQAELRLDTADFIETLVRPGDADGSPLFQRLTTEEPIRRMPPVSSGRSLSSDQIQLVRTWIEQGAHRGADPAPAGAAPAAVAERTVDFAREVRPLLSQNCFSCHGPDEGSRQAGLRLDVPEGPFADRGGFGGPAIVAGDAAASLLVHRVSAGDARVRMPRGGEALDEAEVETLRLWIDQGAEWESHWAFIPPERPAVPPVADAEWPRNPIDRFVLRRLDEAGLTRQGRRTARPCCAASPSTSPACPRPRSSSPTS